MLGLAGYNPHVDTHPTASPLLPAPSFADDGPALELYIYYFSPPSVFFFIRLPRWFLDKQTGFIAGMPVYVSFRLN